MKGLKRKLKTFPAKRSALKNAEKLNFNNNLAENIEKNAENIEKEENSIQIFSEIKTEDVIVFEEKKPASSGFEILGELLGFLRKQRYMSALMLCRQIVEIIVKDDVAFIDLDDDSTKVFMEDDKIKEQVQEFFVTQGLSFKLKNKQSFKNPADELNELLGGNLIKIH